MIILDTHIWHCWTNQIAVPAELDVIKAGCIWYQPLWANITQ
jgi:hypothetical protein